MADSILQCRHFGECGGCQSLNTPYSLQLRRKQALLEETFKAWSSIKIHPILACDTIAGYRHKVQLPFGIAKTYQLANTNPTTKQSQGKVSLGCYATESHRVIDQFECHIQDPDLNQVAWAIRTWASKQGIPAYNELKDNGTLRHVLLRKGLGTGEILIGLITNSESPPGTRVLSRSLLETVSKNLDKNSKAKVVGIVQNVNMRQTNVVLGEREVLWWGRPFLKEKLGKFTFHIELSSFFQVNPYQTPKLYDAAAKWVPEGSRVLEAYCGLGSITLWIAEKCKEVLGIEENPASIQSARSAAKHNQVNNVRFLQGDASRLIAEKVHAGFDVALVDPPRKGLESAAIQSFKDAKLRRLVYVSCNPESLERDAKALSPALTLKEIQPVDMFPHTQHIECVALFEG